MVAPTSINCLRPAHVFARAMRTASLAACRSASLPTRCNPMRARARSLPAIEPSSAADALAARLSSAQICSTSYRSRIAGLKEPARSWSASSSTAHLTLPGPRNRPPREPRHERRATAGVAQRTSASPSASASVSADERSCSDGGRPASSARTVAWTCTTSSRLGASSSACDGTRGSTSRPSSPPPSSPRALLASATSSSLSSSIACSTGSA
mmetsp:Transcript_14081/g.46557  ORF Transcript_14081/g.46557 Transcript_14081/m.46557 type:complete len:212 (-) Transcript_14081:349-984(-)